MSLEKIFSKLKGNQRAAQEEGGSNYDNLAAIDNPKRFRINLLSEKDRGKLSEAITKGEISSLDESGNKIAEIIGRKEYARIFHESVRSNIQEAIASGSERRRELLAAGKDREPFVLENAPVSLVDIHGLRSTDIAALGRELPEGLDAKLVEVDYLENSAADNTDNVSEESGEVLKMTDSSGKINGGFLAERLKNQEQASFIMTGGNLRGCFMTAVDSLLRAADSTKDLRRLDIHIPADYCYDADVYDDLTGFNDIQEALKNRLLKKPAEFYKNRCLQDATGKPGEIESKYRIYSWDKAEDMFREFKSQTELESVRSSIGREIDEAKNEK